MKKIKAFQIKKNGKGYEELQVNEATVPVKELLGISREKGVSMSVLLTTAFICAIHEEMSRIQEKNAGHTDGSGEFKKDISIRFDAEFLWLYRTGISVWRRKMIRLKMYWKQLRYILRENLSKEHMAGRMNELIAIEKHKF